MIILYHLLWEQHQKFVLKLYLRAPKSKLGREIKKRII